MIKEPETPIVRELCGKKIYIVNSHNYALIGWADYRCTVDKLPILFTIDHHKDTRDGFASVFLLPENVTYEEFKNLPADYNEAVEKIKNIVSYKNSVSINKVAQELNYDEQIDAAIKLDIFSKAFVLSVDGTSDNPEGNEVSDFKKSEPMWWLKKLELPSRPYTYPIPENKIYIIGNNDFNCSEITHTDDCSKAHSEISIESVFLKKILSTMNEMDPGIILNDIIQEDYILDIDLDYFHSKEAIHPKDSDVFYKLIRNAKAITIAREPDCVRHCKLKGEDIDDSYLLEELIKHIELVLC